MGEHTAAVPVEVRAVGLGHIRPVHLSAEPPEVFLQESVRSAWRSFQILGRDPPGAVTATGGHGDDRLRAAALELTEESGESPHLG